MIESPLGDIYENALMLFIDDLVDLVVQGGAVQEIRVVCSARRENFPRFIDDGFDILSAGPLVLRLDMEHQALVFNVCIISGHCSLFYPVDIINGKTSSRLSLLSCQFRMAIRKDKTSTLFCRVKRCLFVLYFPKVDGRRGRQVEKSQQADYY